MPSVGPSTESKIDSSSCSIEALLETDQRILDIALDHGFESQEAYTRAFRAQFELPPGRFRRRGQRVSLALPQLVNERIASSERLRSLEPRIELRESTCYVGVRGRLITALSPETDGGVVIPDLWRRFAERRREIDDALGDHDFGVIALPAGGEFDGSLLYTAATRVARIGQRPEGLSGVEVGSARYAVFEHRASFAALGQTVVHALARWLPSSGFDYGGGAELERFPCSFDPNAADLCAEYWLPLRERSAT